jgi:hypothetical protein
MGAIWSTYKNYILIAVGLFLAWRVFFKKKARTYVRRARTTAAYRRTYMRRRPVRRK